MDLPKLHDTPTRHPDLCLSISTRLLQTLTEILTTATDSDGGGPDTHNNLVLSVGSGTGLLEAHLQASLPASFTVKGIEVAPVNKYLPDPHAPTARGSWEVLAHLAAAAAALVFVYPRDPRLVARYLEAAAGQGRLRVVLWLGPRADWDVFGGVVEGFGEGFGEVEVIDGEGAGVAGFEMVAVLRRRR